MLTIGRGKGEVTIMLDTRIISSFTLPLPLGDSAAAVDGHLVTITKVGNP